jgi:hypothetical protein
MENTCDLVEVFIPPQKEMEAFRQGDQIGRIFALWVFVFFGQFEENYRIRPNV